MELKNDLIRQGRYTDCVDELIYKIASAKVKKGQERSCEIRHNP